MPDGAGKRPWLNELELNSERSCFKPTRRDTEGLERLMGEIAADGGQHDGYRVSCFNEEEARWIKRSLELWRPELLGQLSVTWMSFPHA